VFAINGAVRLAYDDLGPPGGEPILMPMGLAASRFWWRWHGPKLRELRVPALVMCGGADPILRTRASRETAAAVSGARLTILPGAGHIPPPESWAAIARAVRDLR
jgi:pimeloyl-ACP methyl ester carboxylesterase